MKETLIYPSKVLGLLQNVGEIISTIKFLRLPRIYGKIITLQETQIEFLFLVLNLMLMPFLICGQQITVIQEVFSLQEKPQSLSHFYIVDSVTNMFSIMSMNVMMILHGNLMMTTHPMPLLLIDEFIPKVSTVSRLLLLCLSDLHNSQNISMSLTNMLLKIRNCFMILRILWKILIL